MIKRICLGLVCLSSAAVVQAEPGNAFVTIALGSAEQELTIDNRGSDSDSNTAIGIRGGYLFNFDQFFVGPELSYSNNSDFTTDLTIAELGSESVNLGFKAGYHVIPQKLAVVARAGVSFWEVTSDSDFGNFEKSGEDAYYGLGVEYQLVENLVLGASYTALEFDVFDSVEYEITTPEVYFEIRF